ncbi:MFS transporter [Neobacillus sp. MM2021_6]|uniref:MFS transporter n=1 Tax=Bacillaceae TaxID=186817 RepID=UPI00140D9826|nr:MULTISPECIES: MFS transporter [Bacillaceae]MBO0962319.1 MFS transporter [Neobacillus sp. MM2021_6]NHC20800.1 MFS transporter [Bacillus sp. MM2020_4]
MNNTAAVGQGMTKKRFTVLAIVFVINFVVWMDESVFAILTPLWSESLKLTPEQIGSASAAYLLGYFPVLFIAGILSDRIGAKKMLFLCLAGVSVLSASMAFVDSYTTLYIRNLIFGIFFGFLWAPCNKMMAMWLPGRERAKYAAIWMSFTTLSGSIGALVGLPLAQVIGWEKVFIIVSVLAVPLIFFLLFKTTDRPEDFKGISKEELAYIYSDLPSAEQQAAEKFQWSHLRDLFKQRSIWTMAIATGLGTTPTWLVGTWGAYTLLNEFKITPTSASLMLFFVSFIPFTLGFVNGPIINKFFGGKCRPALAFGPLVSGMAFLAAALFNPNYIVWVILISGFGFFCNPFFWGTVNAYWAGIAKPQYSGTLNGLSAALQVAVGYILVNMSGKWINPAVHGPDTTDKVWIIGGCVFLATIVFIYLSKEISINPTTNASTSNNGQIPEENPASTTI